MRKFYSCCTQVLGHTHKVQLSSNFATELPLNAEQATLQWISNFPGVKSPDRTTFKWHMFSDSNLILEMLSNIAKLWSIIRSHVNALLLVFAKTCWYELLLSCHRTDPWHDHHLRLSDTETEHITSGKLTLYIKSNTLYFVRNIKIITSFHKTTQAIPYGDFHFKLTMIEKRKKIAGGNLLKLSTQVNKYHSKYLKKKRLNERAKQENQISTNLNISHIENNNECSGITILSVCKKCGYLKHGYSKLVIWSCGYLKLVIWSVVIWNW